MKNWFASAAVVTSCSQFLCFFCCVVPTATGLIALLAAIGLTGSQFNFVSDLSLWLHPYRTYIIVGSIILISISWLIWYYTQKKPEGDCGCHVKKKPVFLIIASLLLGFNLVSASFLH